MKETKVNHEQTEIIHAMPARFQNDFQRAVSTKKLNLNSWGLQKNLTEEELENHVIPFLKANGIIELDLSEHNLGIKGVHLLTEALKVNNELKVLVINSNKLGTEGTRLIAEVLKVNNVLTTLELRSNNIDVEGARAITEALQTNNTLTELDLRLNLLNEESVRLFEQILQNNHTITKLRLGDNIELTPKIQEYLLRNIEEYRVSHLPTVEEASAAFKNLKHLDRSQALDKRIQLIEQIRSSLEMQARRNGEPEPSFGPYDLSDLVSNSFRERAKSTFIYLVTGKSDMSNMRTLSGKRCLSPEQAFEEIKSLNDAQLDTIDALFSSGITGKLLRTFVGPNNFNVHHRDLLKFVMLERSLPLVAETAVEYIQGSSSEQAQKLLIEEMSKKVKAILDKYPSSQHDSDDEGENEFDYALYAQQKRKNIMLEVLKALEPYGTDEAFLKAFALSYPEKVPFEETEKNTLIYLVTGKAPFYYGAQPLTQKKCLSPALAVAEIKDLTRQQLYVLLHLFALDLTGNLLRTFKGPDGFTEYHKALLEHIMQERKPPLLAENAMQYIQGLTQIQASDRLEKEQQAIKLSEPEGPKREMTRMFI